MVNIEACRKMRRSRRDSNDLLVRHDEVRLYDPPGRSKHLKLDGNSHLQYILVVVVGMPNEITSLT